MSHPTILHLSLGAALLLHLAPCARADDFAREIAGDFSDSNWFNATTSKHNTGPPGPSDTALLSNPTTASGGTVMGLFGAGPLTVSGGFNTTTIQINVIVKGGGTLTAASGGADVQGGHLMIGSYSASPIAVSAGGTVVAGSVADDMRGVVDSGSFTTKAEVTDLNISVKGGGSFRVGGLTDGMDVTVHLEGGDFQSDGDFSISGGFLDILPGSSLSVSGDVNLDGALDFDGDPVGGGGGATGPNTSVHVNQSLYFGVQTGTFSFGITKGGEVRAAAIVIGNSQGSKGVVGLDDAGSSMEAIGDGLIIGGRGDGQVKMSKGTLLTVASETVNAFGVGFSAGGTGRLEVNGAGTLVDSTAAEMRVGAEAGSQGVVLLTDGARLLLGPKSAIGYSGSGSVTATGGGQVLAAEDSALAVGSEAGSQGSLSAQGRGSLLLMPDNFKVGDKGTGFLGAGAGAVIQGLGTELGCQTGGEGDATIAGSATRWTNTSGLAVGGTSAGKSGGTSKVKVLEGALLQVGSIILLGDAGEVTIDGTGKITVGGTASTGGALRVNGGGKFVGGGTVHGKAIIAAGGYASPGYVDDRPYGTLTIDGDYQQMAGGGLVIEIGGTTPGTTFDRLHVTGKATLGGTLSLRRNGGFVPGQSITVLDAGSVVGRFSVVKRGVASYTKTAVSVEVTPPAIGDLSGNLRGFLFTSAPSTALVPKGLAAASASSEAAGLVTVTLQANGAFSAKLTVGPKVYSFTGKFDSAGHFQQQVSVAGQKLDVDLAADLSGSDTVTGTIGLTGGASYTVALAHALDPAEQSIPPASAYTIILPPNADNSDTSAPRPQGTGWATVSIKKSGAVTLAGRLADGTAFSAGGTLAEDGTLDAFALLYRKAGLIAGKLSFLPVANSSASDVTGTLRWTKPAQAAGLFAKGFDTTLTPFGSVYVPPPAKQRVFPTGDDGAAALTFTDADLPGGTAAKAIVIATNNRVTYPHPTAATDKLTLSFTAASGAFSGKFYDPTTKSQTAFSGAVLRKTKAGAGYFLGTADSGAVQLSTGP